MDMQDDDDFSPCDDSYDDEDYIPNSASDDDEFLIVPKIKKKGKSVIIHDHMSSSSTQNNTPIPILNEGTSTQKNTDVNITISCINKEDGHSKRQFDKRQACNYCPKLHSRISKHYIVCHSSEELVQEALRHPPGRNRNELMDKLRLLGNYNYNMNILQKKSGNLIVVRRPTHKVKYTDFLPCVHCLGFFKKIELYKHTPKCKFREGEDLSPHLAESKIMAMVGNATTDFYKVLSKRGRCDAINTIIKNDSLILSFGEFLYSSYGEKHYNYIVQRLRELARLLQQFQKDTSDIQLLDLLAPENFDNIVSKTSAMVYSSDCQDKPKSFGIRLGHSLKKCSILAKSRALKSKNETLRKRADEFLQVFEAEWSKRISSICLRNLYDDKLDKEQTIPLTSDLIKLSNFLKDGLKLFLGKSKTSLSSTEWMQLAKLTLVRLINFNKRRAGEVARMEMKDFKNKPNWDIHGDDEIFNSLSDFERKLARKLDLIKVKGKKGRHVAVIMPPDVYQAMKLLATNRDHINENNKYFFANQGDYYLRPWDILKEMCVKANVAKISSITSTTMRIYAATTSQILGLTDEELDILANHLGHDIRIHREYYRLQHSTLELAKVSKLLMALESGEAHKYAGKSLNDIGESSAGNFVTSVTPEPSTGSVNTTTSSRHRSRSRSPQSRDRSLSPDVSSLVPPIKKISKPKVWDTAVKEAALKYFSIEIKMKKAPGKQKCEQFINKMNIDRKWQDVKNLIKNTYYKK